jgi:hypothetical protein
MNNLLTLLFIVGIIAVLSAIRVNRHGGMVFFRIGPVGGSVYISRKKVSKKLTSATVRML